MNNNLKLIPIINRNLPAFYLTGSLDNKEKENLISFYEFVLTSDLQQNKRRKIKEILNK